MKAEDDSVARKTVKKKINSSDRNDNSRNVGGVWPVLEPQPPSTVLIVKSVVPKRIVKKKAEQAFASEWLASQKPRYKFSMSGSLGKATRSDRYDSSAGLYLLFRLREE